MGRRTSAAIAFNDDEHLAVEVAQFVQDVHDIADLLAERIGSLPEAEERRFSNTSWPVLQSVRSNLKRRVACGD